MSTLFLQFAVILHDYQSTDFYHHHGPLSHRWLPDGMNDAIAINTNDPNIELQIWFERWGFVDRAWSNLIKFDYERREVDPHLVRQQAILDAGPLLGLLKIHGLPDDTFAAIRDNKIGDERYVAAGKKVVKLLYPTISRIINILRTNYGQYWLREFENWDSRNSSLGSYCQTMLQLRYSLDNGNTWEEFIPDEPRVYIRGTLRQSTRQTFKEYLTEEDWKELQEVVNSGYTPSLAAITLGRTHQLLDQGNLRQAFVEGVTALELAISELIEGCA